MSNKFFYVHNGLTVGGLTVDANSGGLTTVGIITSTNVTNATTASFSGALQVGGGASVLKDLWIGGTAYANNSQVLTVATIGNFGVTSLVAGTGTAVSTSTGIVTVWSTATLQNVTDRGNISSNAILITNTTNAVTTGTGALVVNGGIGASNAYLNNLVVTNGSVLNGPVTFGGTVTFNGSATYVLSTNTYYTDNMLELHLPPAVMGPLWTVDDGKDIGLRFHYYANSTDTNAALVLANDTKYLEWYSTGTENVAGVFTSTINYGTFKTGAIFLTNPTASNSTNTGALQVTGGVGVGGNLNVQGTVTATLFSGTFQGNATAAYNLLGGTPGQIPYQVSPGITSFLSTASQGWLLMSQPGQPAFVNTASIYVGYSGASANTPITTNANYYPTFFAANSGAVQTFGTTSSFYVNPSTGVIYANVFNGSGDQITAGTIKNSSLVSSTIIVSPGNAGIGIGNSPVSLGGTVLISNMGVLSINGGATGLTPAAATTGTVTLGGVLNLSSGGTSATNAPSPGSIVYGNANAMVFNTPGTAGQLLISTGAGAPIFSSGTNITAGYAITSTNILSGTPGALPYQIAPGITGFIGTGTTGYVLAMGATTATWTTTANLTAGNATTATNVQGGVTGNIPYQVAPGITGFIATGTLGSILQMQIGNTATFVTTGSIQVGFAVSATNILGGIAGQLNYQVSPGVTSFINTGSQGNLLMSQPGAPVYTSTSSIYIGRAVLADLATQATSSTNLSNGTLGAIPYQLASGATAFIGAGPVGYVLAMTASTATWTSTDNLTAGNATTATNIKGGTVGSIPIQSALGITSFINTGSVGSFLSQTSQTTSSFVTTASMYVNAAVYANNLYYGNAGAIPIQTAASGTSFISSGTAGSLLMAGVNTATFVSTASIYVYRATLADLANTSTWATTATNATNVIGGIVSASQVVIVGNLGVTGTTTLSGLLYATNTSTFSGNVITSNIPIVYDQTGISVGVAPVNLDTFSTSTYRSAKYIITVSNSPQYQSTEVLVIHDGTTAYLQDVSVFTGASPIMLFSVGVSGGTVILQGSGTAASNTVKVQRIYTTV